MRRPARFTTRAAAALAAACLLASGPGCSPEPAAPAATSAAPAAASAPPPALVRLQAQARATLERSTRAIDSGRLAGDDLALALCTRALAQADLGDLGAGQSDAARAVEVAPRLADAHHCGGLMHWLQGDFAAAEGDFGQALALGHDPAEALLRRGLARWYGGRREAALEDFAAAAERQADPTGRLAAQLWQAAALQRLHRPLPPGLQAAAAQDPDGDWPRPALALLAGLRDVASLRRRVEALPEGAERDYTAAEAWFHIGQIELAQGRPAAARDAFERVRAAGVVSNPEHAAAGFELDALAR